MLDLILVQELVRLEQALFFVEKALRPCGFMPIAVAIGTRSEYQTIGSSSFSGSTITYIPIFHRGSF